MSFEKQDEKSDSRAQAGAESQTKNNHPEITQQYLGEVDGDFTLQDLEFMVRVAGFDFALELRGEKLRVFRVVVGGKS